MEDRTRVCLANLFRFLSNQGDISDLDLNLLMNALYEKDIWLTTMQVASMLNISPRSVIRYSNKGIFKKYRIQGTSTCRYLKFEILKAVGVK